MCYLEGQVVASHHTNLTTTQHELQSGELDFKFLKAHATSHQKAMFGMKGKFT
jgi:hypothetical protein